MNDAPKKKKAPKELTPKMIQQRIQKSVAKGFQFILASDALGKRIEEKLMETIGGGVMTASSGIDQAALAKTVSKEIGGAIEELLGSPRLKESISGFIAEHGETEPEVSPAVLDPLIKAGLQEAIQSEAMMTVIAPIIEHKVASFVTDQIRVDDVNSLVQFLVPAVHEKVIQVLNLQEARNEISQIKAEVEEKLFDILRGKDAAAQMLDQLQQRMQDSEVLQATIADLADMIEKRADSISSQFDNLRTATDEILAKGQQVDVTLEKVHQLDTGIGDKQEEIAAALSTLHSMREEFETREKNWQGMRGDAQQLLQQVEAQLREHTQAMASIDTARDEMDTRQDDAKELLNEVAIIRDEAVSKMQGVDKVIAELMKLRKDITKKSHEAEAVYKEFADSRNEIVTQLEEVRAAVGLLSAIGERVKAAGLDPEATADEMIDQAEQNKAGVDVIETLISFQETAAAGETLSAGAVENAARLAEEIENKHAEVEKHLAQIDELRTKTLGDQEKIRDDATFISKLHEDLEKRSGEVRNAIEDFASEKAELRKLVDTLFSRVTDVREQIKNDVIDEIGTSSFSAPSGNLSPEQMNDVIKAVLESVTVTFGKVERALQTKLAKSTAETREEIRNSVEALPHSEGMKTRIMAAMKTFAIEGGAGGGDVDLESLQSKVTDSVLKELGNIGPQEPVDTESLKAEITAELERSRAVAGGLQEMDPMKLELTVKEMVKKLVRAYHEDMAERLVEIIDKRIMGRLKIPSPESIQAMVQENVHGFMLAQDALSTVQGAPASSPEIEAKIQETVKQQFMMISDYMEKETIPRIVAEILSKMQRPR
jgi:ABC-type transporter Mla subunit MlaD